MTDSAHNANADGGPGEDRVLDSLHGWSPQRLDGSTTDAADGQVSDLRQENAQLREAIDSRAVIEQAKGALILRYGFDDDAAFAVLRRWSQDSNVKLHTIADILVNTVCRDDPQPPADTELAEWLHEQVRDFPRQDAGLEPDPEAPTSDHPG